MWKSLNNWDDVCLSVMLWAPYLDKLIPRLFHRYPVLYNTKNVVFLNLLEDGAMSSPELLTYLVSYYETVRPGMQS